ncbi:MAG: hypothetical protein NFCOHLIN_02415 [Gammaproteobacteria bacterium]|nr:hypothetical protein [Gammaproteobacteria bacterium]
MKPVMEEIGYVPGPYRLLAALWLTFLLAGMATTVFFAAIDPMELKACVDFPALGRTAAYTVGFFLFWLLTASSGLLCLFFLYPRRRDVETPAVSAATREQVS